MNAKPFSLTDGLKPGSYYFNNAAKLIPDTLTSDEKYEIAKRCDHSNLLQYGADLTDTAKILEGTKADLVQFNALSAEEQVEVMHGVRALLTANIVAPEMIKKDVSLRIAPETIPQAIPA